MINSEHVDILKKITFVSDCLKDCGEMKIDTYQFKLNNLIKEKGKFAYVLKVLNIAFETFTPISSSYEPKELNILFGCKVDFKTIYFLTYIFKEIFGDEAFDLYILYQTKPNDTTTEIVIGSYFRRHEKFANQSRFIRPNEILKINVENVSLKEFSIMFPNEFPNENSNEKCNKNTADGDDHDNDSYDDDTYDGLPYRSGDPRHDRNENPWIDVFGEGDEAETAYWNTD